MIAYTIMFMEPHEAGLSDEELVDLRLRGIVQTHLHQTNGEVEDGILHHFNGGHRLEIEVINSTLTRLELGSAGSNITYEIHFPAALAGEAEEKTRNRKVRVQEHYRDSEDSESDVSSYLDSSFVEIIERHLAAGTTVFIEPDRKSLRLLHRMERREKIAHAKNRLFSLAVDADQGPSTLLARSTNYR